MQNQTTPNETNEADTSTKLSATSGEYLASNLMERRQRLLEFMKSGMMQEGADYGVIPGGTKPTLLKPGAEAICAAFGMSPHINVENRVENWDDGFVAYEVKVTLYSKQTGAIEGEGIGNCNSRERKYKNQDAANVANTILKMAKKRAHVDATLTATGASSLFTQDIEDMDLDEKPQRKAALQPLKSSPTNPQRIGPPPSDRKPGSMPWGNCAGMMPADMDEKDLTYYRRSFQKNIDDGKYVENNTRMVAAIDAELRDRENAADSGADEGDDEGVKWDVDE